MMTSPSIAGHADCGCGGKKRRALEGEVQAVPINGRPFIIALVTAGRPDPNKLTDYIFYIYYRGGKHKPIQAHEKDMIKAWHEIRTSVVVPALALPTPQV